MPYIKNMEQILPSSNLLNGVLHVGFKISFKKWRWYLSEEKKQTEKKTVTIMVFVDGKKDSFSNEIKFTRGMVWIKILKKKIIKQI